jgi:LysM repeat protein
VVGGDSLTKIAAANGTTVSALVSLNSSTYPSLTSNPNVIYPGWVLVLPDGQGGGFTGDTYTVKPGDYLTRIAGITGVPVSTLIDLNAGTYPSLRTNPNIIYTGWVFKLS